MAAIRELIGASYYVIDPASVADAILARCVARHLIAGTTFRSEMRANRPVRSFRRSDHARSFRPSGSRARRG